MRFKTKKKKKKRGNSARLKRDPRLDYCLDQAIVKAFCDYWKYRLDMRKMKTYWCGKVCLINWVRWNIKHNFGKNFINVYKYIKKIWKDIQKALSRGDVWCGNILFSHSWVSIFLASTMNLYPFAIFKSHLCFKN